MNEQAKGNTMYERNAVVAELNKVAGFDPAKFARRVVQDGTERLQLDLKYKKLWFRLKYPQGRIKVTPLKITEQLAIIEAKVFFDRKDTAPTASFIAQRYAKDTPGGLYIESAQYVAADTALDDAGFGLQFVNGESSSTVAVQTMTEPVEKPVEAPVQTIAPTIAPAPQAQNAPQTQDAPQVQDAPQPKVAEQDLQPEPVPAVQTVEEQPPIQQMQEPVQEPVPEAPMMADSMESAVVEEIPQEPLVQEPSIAQEVPADTEQPQTAAEEFSITEESAAAAEEIAGAETASYTADMPVDEICALMTYEEARDIIVDVGTCKGWTLAQVAERRAASLKWYLNGYTGDNNMLKAGAKLMLESLTMDKAS